MNAPMLVLVVAICGTLCYTIGLTLVTAISMFIEGHRIWGVTFTVLAMSLMLATILTATELST